jgi:hypothetical protein
MIPRLITRDTASPESLAGLVLCQDVRADGGRSVLAKGTIIGREHLPVLMEAPWTELHFVQMTEGDLHEDEAGARLAAAAAGDGVEVRGQAGGHWPIAAARRGILEVELDALRRVNSIEGICVYTLYRGQVVDAGEAVARTKITPFVLHESHVREAESVARGAGGLVRVRPFVPMRVGAVVQESLGERAMVRFREALGRKVAWFGSELIEPAFVRAAEGDVADAIDSLARGGAHVIVLAGTKAMDVLDPAFRALERLGIPLERYGVPAHPGSLFWIARRGDTPILGMPTCGLFSQASVFDLVLPRVLVGERVGRAELAELGHGGFLTRDLAFRFPPYQQAKERGAVDVE